MCASGAAVRFYAGDAAGIGADFVSGALVALWPGHRARATVAFPEPMLDEHLDALSAVLGAPSLSDSLEAVVGTLEDYGGCAWVIAPGWVRAVASAEELAAASLAGECSSRWGGGPSAPEL